MKPKHEIFWRVVLMVIIVGAALFCAVVELMAKWRIAFGHFPQP